MEVQGRTASGDSSGGETISRPGLPSCEPPGFRGNAKVSQFHATNNSMDTRVIPSLGFGSAVGFRKFQLRVQEGRAAPKLAISHKKYVAQSSLHVGDVIVEDTSRTRVKVVEPLLGDLRVAQVLNPGDLLPSCRGGPSVCSGRGRFQRPVTESSTRTHRKHSART